MTKRKNDKYGNHPLLLNIGPAIRAARYREDISIKQLANIMGLTPTAISHIEAGNNVPTTRAIPVLLATLNMTPNDLFGIHPDNKDGFSELFREHVRQVGLQQTMHDVIFEIMKAARSERSNL